MPTMVSMFLDESQNLIDEFKQVAEKSDAQAMTRIVHSIKSSGATLGADKISELSKALEEKYRRNEIDLWANEIVELENVFDQTKQALEKMLA